MKERDQFLLSKLLERHQANVSFIAFFFFFQYVRDLILRATTPVKCNAKKNTDTIRYTMTQLT